MWFMEQLTKIMFQHHKLIDDFDITFKIMWNDMCSIYNSYFDIMNANIRRDTIK